MKIIDTDVHNQFRGYRELLPYLPEPWRGIVKSYGLGIKLTYTTPIGLFRKDAMSPKGGATGSDPDYVLEQLINAYNVEYAILSGEDTIHVSSIPDIDYATALAKAYNDYLLDKWLSRSDKFRGSITIATQDPFNAAKEIERLGSHPQFVEVVMSSASRIPYGQRYFHPIYEAAEKFKLPIKLHIGAEGSGINGPPTPSGYPSNYFQWHSSLSQNYMSQLISLVCEGVFERYSSLKFIFAEGGFTWLPHVMWRLDKNYKSLRVTSPWLKKMPSEYIKDHIYFTTQPMEEPDNLQHLIQIIEMIDGKNKLLFSSDYPHWDFDSPYRVLNRLDYETKNKIFYENAKKLYRL